MFSISYGATSQREHRDCGQRWVRNWYANNCRRGSRSQTTQILVILVIFSNFCPFHVAVAVEVCLRSLLWMSLGKKWLSILIKNDSGNGSCALTFGDFRNFGPRPQGLSWKKRNRGLIMDWNIEPLDYFLDQFLNDFFWTIFGTNFFLPFFREKADHKYLRRGGM